MCYNRGHNNFCNTITPHHVVCYTVEPPNKGHFGNGSFVLCSEVVPISEVQLYNPQIMFL